MSHHAIERDQVWVTGYAAKNPTEWTVRYASSKTIVLEGSHGTEITIRPDVLLAQYVLKTPPVFTEPTLLIEVRSPSTGIGYWLRADDENENGWMCMWPKTGRKALVKDVGA